MAADAELWARVEALEGSPLRTGRGRIFVVARVDAAGVWVRAVPGMYDRRLDRRHFAEAAPLLAAGQPLPPRLRLEAPSLRAILRAAGSDT